MLVSVQRTEVVILVTWTLFTGTGRMENADNPAHFAPLDLFSLFLYCSFNPQLAHLQMGPMPLILHLPSLLLSPGAPAQTYDNSMHFSNHQPFL